MSEHVRTLPIDIGFVAVTVLTVLTQTVVVGFHTVFVLLTLSALMLPFRSFLLRLAVWMSVSTALLVWAVASLDVPTTELTEIPILTLVLVLVCLVARARSRAAAASTAANAELAARAELEQRELRQQLEQAQRRELIGRTSAGLSHDLRNVFTVVKGYADEGAELGRLCAHTQGHSDAQRSCLDEVGAAADRGLTIVDELLWLGRQHDSTLQVTDLNTTTRQLEPLLRRLTRADIILRLDIPDVECLVRVDRIGLCQILMNLVSNANDAIVGAGNIRVTARSAVSSQHRACGPRTVLSVTDNGTGFTPEALAKAFDDGFTTKDDEHSGLGLSTVWRIVERCGGSIQIDSSPTTGTTVSISFLSPETHVEVPPRDFTRHPCVSTSHEPSANGATELHDKVSVAQRPDFRRAHITATAGSPPAPTTGAPMTEQGAPRSTSNDCEPGTNPSAQRLLDV